jgi:hypothetical protein
MKIDQIAFYCADEIEERELKIDLGLLHAQWIRDVVTAESDVPPNGIGVNQALLQFNYDLGIELEIIRYVGGRSWHDRNPLAFWGKRISHVGIHLDDDEPFPSMANASLVQETWTKKHTAEYLTKGVAAGRLYHYRIYALSPGSYIKYISRIRGPNESGRNAASSSGNVQAASGSLQGQSCTAGSNVGGGISGGCDSQNQP